MQKFLRRTFDALFLAAALGYYGHWVFDRLAEQGLYTDVALWGFYALGLFHKLPDVGPDFLNVFNRSIPLAVNLYHGPAEVYLAALPCLMVLGRTVWALQVASVMWGFALIPATYVFGRELFRSRLAAAVGVALLVSSPGFIAAARVGLFTGLAPVALFMCALCFAALWHERGRFACLAVAAVFAAFGIACRLEFWWSIPALAVTVVLFRGPWRKFQALAPSRRYLTTGIIASGFIPLLAANVLSRGATVGMLIRGALSPRNGGSNAEYWRHLAIRCQQVPSLLGGASGEGPSSWRSLEALMLAAAAAAVGAAWALGREDKKRLTLPWLLALIIFLQTPITPSYLGLHHILYVMPLLWLAVGSIVCVPPPGRARLAVSVLCAAGVLYSAAANYRAMSDRDAHLEMPGGAETRWNLVEPMARWLAENRIPAVALGDKSLMDPLRYLGVDQEEVFFASYRGDVEEQKARLARRFQDRREDYFIFRPPQSALVPFWDDFARMARQYGKKVSVLRRFSSPTGEPVFIVYKVAAR